MYVCMPPVVQPVVSCKRGLSDVVEITVVSEWWSTMNVHVGCCCLESRCKRPY